MVLQAVNLYLCGAPSRASGKGFYSGSQAVESRRSVVKIIVKNDAQLRARKIPIHDAYTPRRYDTTPLPSFFIFVPSLPPSITVGRRVRVYTRDRFVKITRRHITGCDRSVASYGSAHVYRYGNGERFVVRVFWGHSERDYEVTKKNRKAFVSAESADIDAVFVRGNTVVHTSY